VRYQIEGIWPNAGVNEQWSASLLAKLLYGSFQGDPDANEKINLLAEVAAAAALGYPLLHPVRARTRHGVHEHEIQN
jgi:hypothetical protein